MIKKILGALITIVVLGLGTFLLLNVEKFSKNDPAVKVESAINRTVPGSELQIIQYDFTETYGEVKSVKYVFNVYDKGWVNKNSSVAVVLDSVPAKLNITKNDAIWMETVTLTPDVIRIEEAVKLFKELFAKNSPNVELPPIAGFTLVHLLNHIENPEPVYQIYARVGNQVHMIACLKVYSLKLSNLNETYFPKADEEVKIVE
jgi:hypothetical protein